VGMAFLGGHCEKPNSLYFNVLPFAEDVREFQFPSFRNLPAAFQPTEEQQEAADNLVKMLDLAPSVKQESLKPDLTPNPVLEVLYPSWGLVLMLSSLVYRKQHMENISYL